MGVEGTGARAGGCVGPCPRGPEPWGRGEPYLGPQQLRHRQQWWADGAAPYHVLCDGDSGQERTVSVTQGCLPVPTSHLAQPPRLCPSSSLPGSMPGRPAGLTYLPTRPSLPRRGSRGGEWVAGSVPPAPARCDFLPLSHLGQACSDTATALGAAGPGCAAPGPCGAPCCARVLPRSLTA